MNRIALAARKIRFAVGAQETIEMIDLQNNLVAMRQNQKIFSRLKTKLVQHDHLTDAEVEDIQMVLSLWPNVSAFECSVIDQYLLRAHLLELEHWPECPFDQIPAVWVERLKTLGPHIRPMLREAAA